MLGDKQSRTPMIFSESWRIQVPSIFLYGFRIILRSSAFSDGCRNSSCYVRILAKKKKGKDKQL